MHVFNTGSARVSRLVLAACLVAGLSACTQNEPSTGTAKPAYPLGGADAPAGSHLALQPLTAAAPNTKPVAAATTAPAAAPSSGGGGGGGTKLLTLSLNGDATQVVYPTQTLTPGKLYPALVFAHGHGMDETQMTARTDLAEAATKEGWLAAAGDFQGRAAWGNDAAQHDLANLVAELVAHHQADPARIYLVGFSMGGGTALLAAENAASLKFRVAAVASTQGFTDLEAMTQPEAYNGGYATDIGQAYGGVLSATAAAQHSPIDLAAQLRGVPVYLEHGEADTNVPPTHSTRMAAKLGELGMPAELHTYPGLTHGEGTIHTQSIISFFRGKQAS